MLPQASTMAGVRHAAACGLADGVAMTPPHIAGAHITG